MRPHPLLGHTAIASLLFATACVAGVGAQESAPQEAGLAPPTITVTMHRLAFSPLELVIPPGTTVTWTNADPFEHTVTSDDGLFDSELIPAGGSFSLVFTEPGVYAYYCIPHGTPGQTGMAGLVVVDAAAPPLEAPAPPEPEPQPAPEPPVYDSYGY